MKGGLISASFHNRPTLPPSLGYRLWKMGWLSDAQMTQHYNAMLKPAADFLVDGGKVAASAIAT